MSQPFIAILLGSDSYFSVMQAAMDTLKKLQTPFEVKICSAYPMQKMLQG